MSKFWKTSISQVKPNEILVRGYPIEELTCAQILRSAIVSGKPAASVLAEQKVAGKRMPGYGHPIHTDDPRTKVLLAMADEWMIAGPHVRLAREIVGASQQVLGRQLPMNVDGAIAALMCDMNIDPALGKAFFIIGRAPGYVAHAHEQMTKERPFKAADPDEITYTGPARRPVPTAET